MGCALKLESYYENQHDWSFFEEKQRTEYNYDSNGQLLTANKTEDAIQNESFSYDAMGNRLTYNGVTSTYDNSGQRIQDDGRYTYVYDLNGNIIYKSSKANGISYVFEYSALNQLKKATVTSTPLNGNVLKVLEYKYDPAGRRIIRSVVDNVNYQKSKTKKYYYDGSDILAELDGGDNLTASYTHSPLRPDDVLGAKFTNAAVNNGLTSTAGYVYYLKDHLNTVNEITNANGDIVQKMDYSAFGVLRSVKDSGSNEVGFENAPVRSSFTYTGREFEPELNMYYYRARYYDPNTGRFLQVDPEPGQIASPSTFLSKYIYTANNPIMFTDPSGRSSFFEDLFGWVGLLVVGTINMALGLATLDPARLLTGIAMLVEFAFAPLSLAMTGRTPKLTFFMGVPAVEDSFLAGLPFIDRAFSLGAGMFLKHDDNAIRLENTKKHEYGHTLQYNDWGGWEYLRVGWEQKGICGSFLETNADKRTKDMFPDFVPAYGVCH